ncbi:hypothetical protein N0V93_002208 [Gnomoniopsis smithogilvyi]|uniref:Uncharacterized protein n=1 Tax=Gnomoniopsis smithogilvyi TaxID=1191159 RepID=A0A9W8YUC6_9PEZI|nr:hypothetical protein N0V93_002208 [Gnomoniopsis smithogilvyi]
MESTKSKLLKFFHVVRGHSQRNQLGDRPARPPSVSCLLARRTRSGKPSQQIASTKGDTPLAALYRMYEYIVSGYTIGLRSEIEFFFNNPTWAVADIPDPQDPDPERYAVLAVLPFYMVMAFNRLIQRGLPRGSPFIISTAMEDELKSRPVVLEKEPAWVAGVAKLEKTLVIPDSDGNVPEEASRSARFQGMNIVAEEPHVLFV